MSNQMNPNSNSNPSQEGQLVATGPGGRPELKRCAKASSITFNTLLVVELFIIFLTTSIQGNAGGIIGSLVGSGICIFIYIDVCSEFPTWHRLLFSLKLLTWAVTITFICLTIALLIYGIVMLSKSKDTADRIAFTVYIILILIFLPLGYGFFAAALFSAIRLYNFEMLPSHLVHPQPVIRAPVIRPPPPIQPLAIPMGVPLESQPTQYPNYGAYYNQAYPQLPGPMPNSNMQFVSGGYPQLPPAGYSQKTVIPGY